MVNLPPKYQAAWDKLYYAFYEQQQTVKTVLKSYSRRNWPTTQYQLTWKRRTGARTRSTPRPQLLGPGGGASSQGWTRGWSSRAGLSAWLPTKRDSRRDPSLSQAEIQTENSFFLQWFLCSYMYSMYIHNPWTRKIRTKQKLPIDIWLIISCISCFSGFFPM